MGIILLISSAFYISQFLLHLSSFCVWLWFCFGLIWVWFFLVWVFSFFTYLHNPINTHIFEQCNHYCLNWLVFSSLFSLFLAKVKLENQLLKWLWTCLIQHCWSWSLVMSLTNSEILRNLHDFSDTHVFWLLNGDEIQMLILKYSLLNNEWIAWNVVSII